MYLKNKNKIVSIKVIFKPTSILNTLKVFTNYLLTFHLFKKF